MKNNTFKKIAFLTATFFSLNVYAQDKLESVPNYLWEFICDHFSIPLLIVMAAAFFVWSKSNGTR